MHPMQTPFHFFAATDLVVVGQNPEMADFDNPRGDIIRSAAYVIAEDAKGYRVRQHIRTGHERDVLEEASAQALALNARLQLLHKPPIGFAAWEPHFPAYGSEAYVESGQGEQDAWMDRMEEEHYA